MRLLPWTKAFSTVASSCFVSSPLWQVKQRPPSCLLESSSKGTIADHSMRSSDCGETLQTLTSKVEAVLLLLQEENPKSNNNNNPILRVLTSRLSNLSLNRTYVGTSNVAGRGLFATMDCPKGTLLTCYPGDGLVDNEEDYDDDDEEIYWGDHVLSNSKDDDGGTTNCEYDYQDYLMYLTDEIGLIGLPEMDQDPAYLGHFANDGVVEYIPQPGSSLEETKTTTLAYLEESQTKANAKEQEILNGCHMALVATREISKDEEIFLCYGASYWLSSSSSMHW